jgi:hypothetical protein
MGALFEYYKSLHYKHIKVCYYGRMDSDLSQRNYPESTTRQWEFRLKVRLSTLLDF